jgi:hypothetical protein
LSWCTATGLKYFAPANLKSLTSLFRRVTVVLEVMLVLGPPFLVHVTGIPLTPLDDGVSAPVEIDAKLGIPKPVGRFVLLQ